MSEKAAHLKYRKSAKGRAQRKAWLKTEVGRQAKKRWDKNARERKRPSRSAPLRRSLEPNERHRARMRRLIDEMKTKPCVDCGGSFPPICMDFDHRPGEPKVANVSQICFFALDVVMAEIAKCDLVCANCHRIRTHERRRWKRTHPPVQPITQQELPL